MGLDELFPDVPRLAPRPPNYPPRVQCPACSTVYTDEEVRIAFYWRDGNMHVSTPKFPCRPCAMERRHEHKHQDVYRHKARTATIREYENKYRHLAPNVSVFAETYGWAERIASRGRLDYGRVAADIEAAFTSTCCYCGLPYSDLPDVTIDIYDPTQLPYYGYNTRWPCGTCNRAKGSMSPHDFAIWCAIWRRRRSQVIVTAGRMAPTLFE